MITRLSSYLKYLVFLGVIAGLMSCDSQTSTPRPAPAPPVPAEPKAEPKPDPSTIAPTGERFLTGRELADLYDRFTFCYGLDGSTCRTTEEVTSRSATQLQLRHAYLVRLNQSSSDLLEELFNHLTEKTPFNPQAALYFVQQTHTIAHNGFCRSKSQRLADAEAKTGVWVVDGSRPEGRTEPFSSDKADRIRRAAANAVAAGIGNVECSHYTLDPEGKFLTEYLSIDGVLQKQTPNTIRFIDRGLLLRLRMG